MKKQRKLQQLLQEIVVPVDQFKLTTNEIDLEVIVFEGDPSTPSIIPPDRIIWRSIPVRDLHIEDELRCDIGLTFRKIGGVSSFIRLPRQMSLDIIAE
jgi:hypothetical protein